MTAHGNNVGCLADRELFLEWSIVFEGCNPQTVWLVLVLNPPISETGCCFQGRGTVAASRGCRVAKLLCGDHTLCCVSNFKVLLCFKTVIPVLGYFLCPEPTVGYLI